MPTAKELSDEKLIAFLRQQGHSDDSISNTLANPTRRKIWVEQYFLCQSYVEPVTPLDPVTQAAYDEHAQELRQKIEEAKPSVTELERFIAARSGRTGGR